MSAFTDTVWEAISKNLLNQVQVSVSFDLLRHGEHEQNMGETRLENLEYALFEAAEAVGKDPLRDLLNGEAWINTMHAVEVQRAKVNRELERLDNLLIIIGSRQTGDYWKEATDQGGGPTAHAWKENPSITLTDDQVSTVKEHTP